jgi:hypothetical protein
VKLYSIAGQLVKSLHRVKTSIDISDLPIGVYILNLTSGTNATIRKMVVKE